MPTYTYECEVHGEFEESHSINQELEECPQCQAVGLPVHKPKRLISGGTQFILLGGGWAKDSYR